MKRRTQLILALIALVLAAGAGLYVYAAFNQMVATARVVTPATTIPAGTLIDAKLLTEREVPRPLLDEAIYASATDLIGKVAAVPLRPGMVMYRSFVVPQQQFRLVDDPALAVVSFPVNPARAVGGQVQPGHHVDIWRLGGVKPTTAITLTELSAQQWATATLVVANAPVVDVRASSGAAVARSPQAVPGKSEGGSANGASSSASSSSAALQILTVGVPPETARDILALVAEEDQAGFTLWVTLAPLTNTVPSEVETGWTRP
jgi:Flp pilus assembly protein CpaB